MKTTIIFIILLFSFAVFGQTDLPIKGNLTDLEGKKKVYVVAETSNSSTIIEKLLSKSFEIINDPDKADFIIEFKQIEKTAPPKYGAGAYTDIAEMTAYFYNPEKKKVVAWAQTNDAFKKGWGFPKKNEETLSKAFLKALEKK